MRRQLASLYRRFFAWLVLGRGWSTFSSTWDARLLGEGHTCGPPLHVNHTPSFLWVFPSMYCVGLSSSFFSVLLMLTLMGLHWNWNPNVPHRYVDETQRDVTWCADVMRWAQDIASFPCCCKCLYCVVTSLLSKCLTNLTLVSFTPFCLNPRPVLVTTSLSPSLTCPALLVLLYLHLFHCLLILLMQQINFICHVGKGNMAWHHGKRFATAIVIQHQKPVCGYLTFKEGKLTGEAMEKNGYMLSGYNLDHFGFLNNAVIFTSEGCWNTERNQYKFSLRCNMQEQHNLLCNRDTIPISPLKYTKSKPRQTSHCC